MIIRKRFLNPWTALLVGLMYTLSGPSAQAALRPTASKHPYSGEEMFRGVFFAEGRYAMQLPEIRSLQTTVAKRQLSLAKQNEVVSIRQKICQRLLSADPLFYNKFRTALESHNPVRIKDMLAQTSKQLKQLTSVKATMGHDQGKGVCVLVITSADSSVIIDSSVVVALIAVQEIAQADSSLMTEQLAASICRASVPQS